MTGAAAQALIADPQLAHDVTRVGRIVMLLLQAATDPTAVLNPSSDLKVVTDDNATDLETLLKQLPQSFTPTKFVRLQQLVSRHAKQGTKVLVWSSFRHNINRMQRLLEPFEPATITGDVPVQNPSKPTDRIREIERFRTDPRCTVLMRRHTPCQRGSRSTRRQPTRSMLIELLMQGCFCKHSTELTDLASRHRPTARRRICWHNERMVRQQLTTL
jgi:hypothetical protein